MTVPSADSILPLEMWKTIFQYMERPLDLMRCEKVCKFWKEIITTASLWKEMCKRQSLPISEGDNINYKSICLPPICRSIEIPDETIFTKTKEETFVKIKLDKPLGGFPESIPLSSFYDQAGIIRDDAENIKVLWKNRIVELERPPNPVILGTIYCKNFKLAFLHVIYCEKSKNPRFERELNFSAHIARERKINYISLKDFGGQSS